MENLLEPTPERELATVRRISSLEPIVFINEEGSEETANAIEYAQVGGWNVVVQKGLYNVGDLCIYVEIDSILPVDKKEFAFLDGKRLRTKKLKGYISQGICFPLFILETVLPGGFLYSQSENHIIICDNDTDALYVPIEEDLDLTLMLGVTKYEPGEPQDPNAKGSFPSFIPKTNESRVQNIGRELRKYAGSKAYSMEKMEGSSITLYAKLNPDETVDSGICSRNNELKIEDSQSKFVVTGKPYLDKLVDLVSRGHIDSIALQGELIGEGIQGNIYKLKGHTIKFFTAYNISKGKRLDIHEFTELINRIGAEHVPIIDTDLTLVNDTKLYLEMADGKSMLNPNTNREGLVIRTYDNTFSMKAISNKYLLKQK
jgi:RNA ligase (TIGR02306 family)